jgi:hypothetical protein
MVNWNNAIRLGNLNQYYPRRRAHVVEVEEEEEVGETATNEDPKTVFAANGYTRPRGTNARPSSSKTSAPPKPRWPEGKTVKGYAFVKRDDVHSEHPLPGGCYICTSDKHYACDCPHYGTWLTMRNANLIDSAVDSIQESEDLLAYLAMMVEVNGTNSDYGRELAKILSQRPLGKEIHVVDTNIMGAARAHLPPSQHHCNGRRREETERRKSQPIYLDKGKQSETEDLSWIFHEEPTAIRTEFLVNTECIEIRARRCPSPLRRHLLLL